MVNNITELPDDIISHILSFLSIRDTLIARLSSPQWLNLPDCRSVIDLNATSVLGKVTIGDRGTKLAAAQAKFMEIANRFMQLWSGNRMTTLIIRYAVAHKHFGEIENWIAKAFSMGVECIQIKVSKFEQKFIFHCTATATEPHLEHLSLVNCTPTFLDFGYTSWLSKLTTFRLENVPLDGQRMGLFFASAPNLVALDLINCGMGRVRIDGQLIHLKKLKIIDDLMGVSLNCPSLEVFDYTGRLASLRLAHVPLLREAHMFVTNMNLPSVFFNDINIQAPSLETLSITLWNEIGPVPPHLVRHGLKKLKINLLGGFDLLSIKYLLNACPCLEELEVRVFHDNKSNPEIGVIGRMEYWDQRKHPTLRRVKMEHFYEHWNAMKLAKYILRNAVVLEEMEIVTPRHAFFVLEYFQSLRILMEKVNPAARFVVSHMPFKNHYW